MGEDWSVRKSLAFYLFALSLLFCYLKAQIEPVVSLNFIKQSIHITPRIHVKTRIKVNILHLYTKKGQQGVVSDINKNINVSGSGRGNGRAVPWEVVNGSR